MGSAPLARRQKRLQNWRNFLKEEVEDPTITNRTTKLLDQYQTVITRCWEAEAISAGDELELTSLERELEELDELARMTVGPR